MLVLLKSKLLKQSNISNKKECHPLPTPILFINIIFNYSLIVRRKENLIKKRILSAGMVYRVVIAKFYANGFRKMNNQEIKFVVSFFVVRNL